MIHKQMKPYMFLLLTKSYLYLRKKDAETRQLIQLITIKRTQFILTQSYDNYKLNKIRQLAQ